MGGAPEVGDCFVGYTRRRLAAEDGYDFVGGEEEVVFVITVATAFDEYVGSLVKGHFWTRL